jgi:hypothetical protein
MRFSQAAKLVASLVVLEGCSAADARDTPNPRTESSLGSAQGTVFNTKGLALNVRAKPSTQSAVIGTIASGAKVKISCQQSGDAVQGNSVWDFLPAYGGYVSDAYLNTGHAGFVPGLDKCNASGCGELSYAGECQEDELLWCENGKKHSEDCAKFGKVCGYQDASVGYNCLDSGSGVGGNGELLTVSGIVGNVDYAISQGYGPTTFDGGYSYCHSYGAWNTWLVHCGVDVGIPYGTELHVPGNGTVLRAGGSGYYEDAYNKAAGELKIRLESGDEVILGHMTQIDLWVGQSVSYGQAAGLSGTMNGPHVHIEVRVPDSSTASGLRTVDPMTYFGW